jgi:hypothetical protein
MPSKEKVEIIWLFVANIQGLFNPNATSTSSFDENVLVAINIDTDGAHVEDFVIQAIPRVGIMYFFGLVVPAIIVQNSTISEMASILGQVVITPYASNAVTASNSRGMKIFAGPKEDPFFMDFARYREILAGDASGFDNPGADTFAGSNVLSIEVEVPRSMVGSSGSISIWVGAKVKQ